MQLPDENSSLESEEDEDHYLEQLKQEAALLHPDQ